VAKQLVFKKLWCTKNQHLGYNWAWFATCSKCYSEALWTESSCSFHQLV